MADQILEFKGRLLKPFVKISLKDIARNKAVFDVHIRQIDGKEYFTKGVSVLIDEALTVQIPIELFTPDEHDPQPGDAVLKAE